MKRWRKVLLRGKKNECICLGSWLFVNIHSVCLCAYGLRASQIFLQLAEFLTCKSTAELSYRNIWLLFAQRFKNMKRLGWSPGQCGCLVWEEKRSMEIRDATCVIPAAHLCFNVDLSFGKKHEYPIHALKRPPQFLLERNYSRVGLLRVGLFGFS